MGPLRAAGEAWKGGFQGRTSPYPLSKSVAPPPPPDSYFFEDLVHWIYNLNSFHNLTHTQISFHAGLEFPHGHRGHCLSFFKFGYDALRPMSTFTVFFTTSWPWCLFVSLPNGLSAPIFKILNSRLVSMKYLAYSMCNLPVDSGRCLTSIRDDAQTI